MMVRYFAILFDDEASIVAPDAIFRSVDDGAYLEHLSREDGWIDNPNLASYFRGEPGAEPISEQQARRIAENWGVSARVFSEPPFAKT